MKRIGLLGGMSWESSMEYYRIMNEEVKERLGGSHSADCLMYSFDFSEIELLQHAGKWEELTDLMVNEAMNLKKGGADAIVICTNTMHLMADDIIKGTGLPLIHIAEATAAAIAEAGIRKVLLLGTKFTMNSSFYAEKLNAEDIEMVIPDEKDQDVVHEIIYGELVRGIISEESRQKYADIISKMAEQEGIEGVILGCTEIPLLIRQSDVEVKVFDTTAIHAAAAVDFSLD